MSETISQIPAGSTGFMSDLIPLTQGAAGPGTGTTRTLTTAKVLATSGTIYAGDPSWVGGVKADGISDDTAAWNAAIATASLTGAWVVAPIGVSLVTGLTVPSNVGIMGRSVESYSGTGSTTLGSIIKSVSSSVPAITMAPFSQLMSLQISGISAQPCVRATGGAVNLTDVTCFGGSIGVDCATAGGQSMISSSRIYQCGIGIANCVATQISDCLISFSSNHGILLSTGCVNNIISGCRIESSANDNIHIETSASDIGGNVITTNSIDSSGKNNISLRNARNTTITGNSIGRGGASSSGIIIGTSVDANIFLSGCAGVAIVGNTTWVGRQNVNSYTSPYYAIWDDGLNGSGASPVNIFSGNILQCHNNSAILPSPPLAINTTATFSSLVPYNVISWV